MKRKSVYLSEGEYSFKTEDKGDNKRKKRYEIHSNED